jgi:dTDP-4-amino-4,6-dideoxygalactose transaminase
LEFGPPRPGRPLQRRPARRRDTLRSARLRARLSPLRGARYAEHVYHLFVIQTAARDELQRYLSAAGVHTGIHYPVPVHLQPAYEDLDLGPGSLPETESSAREVISLPFYPELLAAEVDRVIALVNEFYGA